MRVVGLAPLLLVLSCGLRSVDDVASRDEECEMLSYWPFSPYPAQELALDYAGGFTAGDDVLNVRSADVLLDAGEPVLWTEEQLAHSVVRLTVWGHYYQPVVVRVDRTASGLVLSAKHWVHRPPSGADGTGYFAMTQVPLEERHGEWLYETLDAAQLRESRCFAGEQVPLHGTAVFVEVVWDGGYHCLARHNHSYNRLLMSAVECMLVWSGPIPSASPSEYRWQQDSGDLCGVPPPTGECIP